MANIRKVAQALVDIRRKNSSYRTASRKIAQMLEEGLNDTSQLARNLIYSMWSRRHIASILKEVADVDDATPVISDALHQLRRSKDDNDRMIYERYLERHQNSLTSLLPDEDESPLQRPVSRVARRNPKSKVASPEVTLKDVATPNLTMPTPHDQSLQEIVDYFATMHRFTKGDLVWKMAEPSATSAEPEVQGIVAHVITQDRVMVDWSGYQREEDVDELYPVLITATAHLNEVQQ